MKLKQISLLTVIFLVVNQINLAQIGGSSTYQCLELSTSPFANALGGKSISNPQSIDLVFFNPALLDSAKTFKMSLSYQNYLADIQLGDFIFSFPKTKLGNFAYGVHYINYGKFEQYDEFGFYYGNFSASEYVPFLTYTLEIDSQVSIGANFKMIYSKLQNYLSYGYALDIGLYVKVNPYLFLALAARNFGSQIKPYNTEFEPLPFNISAGITGQFRYSPLRFNFTFDYLNYWKLRYHSYLDELYLPSFADTISTVSKVEQYADELLRHLHFGVEILFSKNFHLMIGYNYRRGKELSLPTLRTINGFSLGLVIFTPKFDITYSLQKFITSNIHSFGLTVDMSQIPWKKIKKIFSKY